MHKVQNTRRKYIASLPLLTLYRDYQLISYKMFLAMQDAGCETLACLGRIPIGRIAAQAGIGQKRINYLVALAEEHGVKPMYAKKYRSVKLTSGEIEFIYGMVSQRLKVAGLPAEEVQSLKTLRRRILKEMEKE